MLFNLASGKACTCAAVFRDNFLSELRRCEIWPLARIIQHTSPLEIMDRVSLIDSLKLADYGGRVCQDCGSDRMPYDAADLVDDVRASEGCGWNYNTNYSKNYNKDGVIGLCLDCVKTGG